MSTKPDWTTNNNPPNNPSEAGRGGTRRSGGFTAVLLFLAAGLGFATAQEQEKVLRCGWYRFEPYQIELGDSERKQLSGLDIELMRTSFGRMGYTVEFRHVSWDQQLADLKAGRLDIAMGGTLNRKREEHLFFSKPYRLETNGLFFNLNSSFPNRFDSVPQFLQHCRDNQIRIGIIKGYSYISREIREFIEDPANADLLVEATNDYLNFQNLVEARVACLLGDRLTGKQLIINYGWDSLLAEHTLAPGAGPVRVMFSKKTTTPEMVIGFNQTMGEIRQDGTYHQLVKTHFLPSLLQVTMNQGWFFFMDILGTIAFALSGILLARKENYDLIGAMVLASLPAVGGGVLRDFLVNRNPIGVLQSPLYLILVMVMVLSGYFIYYCYDRFFKKNQDEGDSDQEPSLGKVADNVVMLADAMGLGAFTIVGVAVAVQTLSEPLWLWGALLAMLTGAGGGILRDIVRADSNNPSLKGSFYPEIALIWGFIYALFLDWEIERLQLHEIYLGTVAIFAATVMTRILVVVYGLRSPTFRRTQKGQTPTTSSSG